MKITFVAETLDPSTGGIPRYSYEISKIKDINNVIDFSEFFNSKGVTNKVLNRLYKRKKILEKLSGKLGGIVHFGQPEIMVKSDVLDGKKIILTVHDLAVFGTMKVTNAYGRLRGVVFRSQFRHAIKRADLILVDSSQTKRELMDVLRVGEKKVFVITLGVSQNLRPLGKKPKNIIGYFGGFNKRKRVEKLILDFLTSRMKKDHELWLYGTQDGEYAKLVKKYGRNDGIVFKGKVKEEDVIKTLNSFKYFVFPTSYEGLGLPILEGIACGVPTCIYTDAVVPDEVKRFPKRISKLDDIMIYDYKALKRRFLKESKRVKQFFSWERTRNETVKAYKLVSSQ